MILFAVFVSSCGSQSSHVLESSSAHGAKAVDTGPQNLTLLPPQTIVDTESYTDFSTELTDDKLTAAIGAATTFSVPDNKTTETTSPTHDHEDEVLSTEPSTTTEPLTTTTLSDQATTQQSDNNLSSTTTVPNQITNLSDIIGHTWVLQKAQFAGITGFETQLYRPFTMTLSDNQIFFQDSDGNSLVCSYTYSQTTSNITACAGGNQTQTWELVKISVVAEVALQSTPNGIRMAFTNVDYIDWVKAQ